jgi:hypothetical protein
VLFSTTIVGPWAQAASTSVVNKEIAAPAAVHHPIECWLLDGQVGEIRIVPGRNASGIEIDHRDLDLGTAIGND